MKVIINCGGIKYITYKNTLLKSSYFHALFQFNQNQFNIDDDDQREQEEIFLDRDAELFNIILGFLRSGQINKDINNLMFCDALIEEAKFFQIDAMIDEIIIIQQDIIRKQKKKDEQNNPKYITKSIKTRTNKFQTNKY